MAKTNEEIEKSTDAQANMLGVKKSKVTLAGFKSKKPEDLEKERARNETLVAKRLKNRIAKAKADSKAKPIDKRRSVLIARFKAVKSRRRAYTYSNKNIEAWLEELDMIERNPKSWELVTKNGTVSFVPGNKKKKTAKDILDEMDLEED